MSANDFAQREFPMTDKDFSDIREIAYKLTGINLSEHKKNMIYGRLARRLRRLNLNSFREYVDLIRAEDSPEMVDFVNSITTNLTSFFRENHHFENLRDTVIPDLIKKNAASKRIRIWSAGCSTGEEPYSIAMVLASFAQIKNWDVKVLATDLDSNVVAKAAGGEYPIERAENIPDEYRRFLEVTEDGESVQAGQAIQSLIAFKQLNLLNRWPMKGPFDVIFCRNVVIYFDAETQTTLFDRYANLLTEKGRLFIGHSESLHNVCTRFSSLGRTMYEKIK